jgi:hypothetical protein
VLVLVLVRECHPDESVAGPDGTVANFKAAGFLFVLL